MKDGLSDYLRTESYRIVLHVHSYRLLDVPAGEKAFFLLRDPAQRFVSGFNSRLRRGQPRFNNPWTEGEARTYGRFATPDELAVALSSPTAEVRGGRGRDAEHRPRQHPLLVLARLPRLLPLSNFGRAADRLSGDAGGKLFRRRGILGLPDTARLPGSEQEMHRTPEHLDKSLSTEARQNLENWYAEDYAFLELCVGLGK